MTPASVDLRNATILAIDPGRRDILHGVFHTVTGGVEAPLDGRNKIFRLSKGCYRTECGMRRRKEDTDRRMVEYPGLEEYTNNILSPRYQARSYSRNISIAFHTSPRLCFPFLDSAQFGQCDSRAIDNNKCSTRKSCRASPRER